MVNTEKKFFNSFPIIVYQYNPRKDSIALTQGNVHEDKKKMSRQAILVRIYQLFLTIILLIFFDLKIG